MIERVREAWPEIRAGRLSSFARETSPRSIEEEEEEELARYFADRLRFRRDDKREQ